MNSDPECEIAAGDLRQAGTAALHFTGAEHGGLGRVEGHQQQVVAPPRELSVVSEGNPFHPVQASSRGLPCHGFVNVGRLSFGTLQPCPENVAAFSLAHSNRLIR